MTERFRALFTGGNLGYGEWDQQFGGITRKGDAPISAYEKHLKGEKGLGLVPVTAAGTCHFAAIDIDDDNIDHKLLLSKVRQRCLPLHVCRSKSGGAHLYLFMNPPLPASQVQTVMKRWTALLGYPSAEIFPKQTKIGPDNLGNWINLPYFGSDDTTRYQVGEAGALTLAEFLDNVVYYDPTAHVDETVSTGTTSMPPCLAAIMQHSLGDGGGRNSALFNYAVFYRKSQPTTWEDAVIHHNSAHFSPQLSFREVQSVIRSAGRVRYQYTCDQSPIRDHCDRATCQTLPFGVSHMPWKEHGAFDDMTVGHLRKVITNPPRYIIEVNGRDLELSLDDLLSFRAFRKQVFASLDLMVAMVKQEQWEQRVKEMISQKEVIEAPDDASAGGLIMERFFEFLQLRERTTSKEDLLRGLPVQVGHEVLFRISDFKRHLQVFKMDRWEAPELFMMLKRQGCEHKRLRISGRVMAVWTFPTDKVNDQTDDFQIPDFARATEL